MKNLLKIVDEELLKDEYDYYKERNQSLIDIIYKGTDEQIKKIKVYRNNNEHYDYKEKLNFIKANPTLSVDELYEKSKK